MQRRRDHLWRQQTSDDERWSLGASRIIEMTDADADADAEADADADVEYAEFTGTEEEAESFLNANIDIAKGWILKHVPRKTLEAWVAEKRLSVRGNEQQTISIRESRSRSDSIGVPTIFEQVDQRLFHLFQGAAMQKFGFWERKRGGGV